MIRETPKTPRLLAAAAICVPSLNNLSRYSRCLGTGAAGAEDVYPPPNQPRKQMGRQALIEGGVGHTWTYRVRAIHHLNDTRHGGYRGLRFKWLLPCRLHTPPYLWQLGRNEGRLRRTHRAVNLRWFTGLGGSGGGSGKPTCSAARVITAGKSIRADLRVGPPVSEASSSSPIGRTGTTSPRSPNRLRPRRRAPDPPTLPAG